ITLTGADGITLTGADGITLTGADSVTGVSADGTVNTFSSPAGITLTGADGITLTGADGITLTGADGITLTGADEDEANNSSGLQSVDPELAILLNQSTDDSNINAVIVYHQYPSNFDLTQLQQIGVLGGTRYKVLPMVAVSATRQQLFAISHLRQVRSLYGNRTLNLNSDPYFQNSGVQRIAPDKDLQTHNGGVPISGQNVTVAVLDTGVNSQHSDLSGKVVQNVRLLDSQSISSGFSNPAPVENVVNTDPVSGHGTFVSGVIAANGISSGGKYNGVAPGAKILGLSAGDLNLSHILSGFDYLLDRGANYNVRVVNCSFSSNTVFDYNDPVNVATKMLTERGVNVVFSAGNSGSGNATLNPYASAPWVVGVGAVDEKGRLASFSSRGVFGAQNQKPSLVATGVNVVSLRGVGTTTGTLGFANGADTQRLTTGEMAFYTTASGTSFSAPQVAGAIALMLEANPNLRPFEIKDILQRTATPLPRYYSHEVGAGVLNTHAAVLESAFSDRKIGLFRASLIGNEIIYTTSVSHIFNKTVQPGGTTSSHFAIPSDTIQANVNIAWGIGVNDLSLKLFDASGTLVGNSNYLNAPGFTGSREKIVVNTPSPQIFKADVQHTGGVGISQKYFGLVETTRVTYPQLIDLSNVSTQDREIIKESLRSFIMLPEGKKFNPSSLVTRFDFASALVRSGSVPQYLAGSPIFTDVRNLSLRNAVESVQTNPSGKLFFDASNGGAFHPFDTVSKIVATIALVKAAQEENLTTTATLPLTVADANSIPTQWRGYIAVALQKGLISLDGNNFNGNRAITRLELTKSLTKLINLKIE
ncbi:MAG: S8 family serine peptidase, partial [Acidobacteria bacterium]|nr:S8 family serine peptidase [Acidobacteriota bacterium]MCA1639666.1 S8 family serine peptidase [Acidobacteriota bacterium]